MPPIATKLFHSLTALNRSQPDDVVTRKALRLTRAATRVAPQLSVAERALVLKSVALAVDSAATDPSPHWYSDEADSVLDGAATGNLAPGDAGKVLTLANALDTAQKAVKGGAPERALQVGHAIDLVHEHVAEKAQLAGEPSSKLPLPLKALGLFLAFKAFQGMSRRGR